MKHNFKNYQKHTHQRGFTLIEMAIVLMVIGVLAMASVYGFGVYRTTKNEAEARKINGIMSALQNKWKFDPTTSTITNSTVNSAGILTGVQWPITVSGTTVTILNPYSGAVTFAPGTITTAGDAFSLTYANVPSGACSDIARNVESNAYNITIGATVVQSTPSVQALGTAIDAACTAAAAQSMILVYSKYPS